MGNNIGQGLKNLSESEQSLMLVVGEIEYILHKLNREVGEDMAMKGNEGLEDRFLVDAEAT